MDPDQRRSLTALRLLAAGVVAGSLMLTGCTSGPPAVDGPHRLIVATGVPRAMAGVGFGGTLGYDTAGCVVLGGDAVLVAPPGSTLKDGVMTLDFGAAGERPFTIGRTTDQLGGMEVGPGSGFVPAGTRCSSTRYFLLG